MQVLTEHIPDVSTPGAHLAITCGPDTDAGGACTAYTVGEEDVGVLAELQFQDGPVGDVGANGLTNEVLLAILVHRMRGYCNGPYNCMFNVAALRHLERALNTLHMRTKDRVSRQVEGTLQK